MNRLRILREEKELNQAQLAKLWNTSASAISHWENGNNEMDYNTLCKAADFYGTSIDYILGRDSVSDVKDQRESDILSMYRHLSSARKDFAYDFITRIFELP